MDLVIDANRLFSVIITKRLSSSAMEIFFSDSVDFFPQVLNIPNE